MIIPKFYLRVRQVEQHCFFDLSWGQGQRLPEVKLPLSQSLQISFQQWQADYLQHYNTLPLNPPPESETILRGKLVKKGSVTPPSNTHSFLVGAQETLLIEFHDWLRRRELHEIRAKIAKASHVLSEPSLPEQKPVELLITCDPLDLARLPWETWEIGAEYATTGTIRITRVPTSVRSKSAQTSRQRHRPRILAIIGDDRNLDLKVDQSIMSSLATVAEIQFVRRHPVETIDELKTRIVRAITQDIGWDMLFFAGHSSETNLTGGEIEIAPGASIQISEIKYHLETAQQRGLQVAVFNSCEGLSFAESLIDLGLNQVVVMREKVHNRVAQAFLLRFCQSLAQHKDIHESLITASQFLKTEKNLTYPSGYLLPSLFRHPEATLFYIPSKNWYTWLKRLKPKRHELIVVTGLSFISLLLPVQQWLLDHRANVQARLNPVEVQKTAKAVPPLLVVEIDEASINDAMAEAGTQEPVPIPQGYLSKVIKQLAALQPKVIGIDYLIDRPQTTTPQLGKAVSNATNEGTKFVFVMIQNGQGEWVRTLPEIADAQTTIHTDAILAHGDGYYVPQFWTFNLPIPFAYGLAWLHEHCVRQTTPFCRNLDTTELEKQVKFEANSNQPRVNRNIITLIAHALNQRWLHPITDFSVSPTQIYRSISAQELLQQPDHPILNNIQKQTVLIISNYPEAGIQQGSEMVSEVFLPPSAMRYWYQQSEPQNPYRDMTNGEHHAYLFDHFLNRRWVVPIPDLWMILFTALAGKIAVIYLQQRTSKFTQTSTNFTPQLSLKRWSGVIALTSGTVFYILISLELYASPAAILLPILLPVSTFWFYVLPTLAKRK